MIAPKQKSKKEFNKFYILSISFILVITFLALYFLRCSDPSGINDIRKPDLVIHAFSHIPDTLKAGNDFSLSMTVKNIGTAASTDSCKASVYFKTFHLTLSVPPLIVDDSVLLLFSSFSPTFFDTGSFKIKGNVDVEDKVKELLETNNVDTLPIFIHSNPHPDFIVDSVMVKPDTIYATDKFYLRAIMRNAGNAPSTDTCTSFVNFKKTYWNMKMPPLAVGETYDLGYHAHTPTEADTGVFYIRGVADSHDSIPELNESNNKDTLVITILPKKKPDFVVDSVMVKPDTIYATEKFYLRAIMRNVGNAPSTDTCTSFVNFKKTYWNMKMPPLAVGETYDLGFHACTPAEADTGMFYIRGVADSHDSIPEQNENNNKDTLIITILPKKKPDFVVDSVMVKPDTIYATEKFYLRAIMRNVGNAPSLDTCTSFVNFKKTYWNMKMPPLAVGETYDLGFHACTPAEADTGMFYIRGVADSHDSIPEQNENNNKDTLVITILPKKKPDFVVDSVMVKPDTIYATEKFYLRAIMRNVGNAPSLDTCTSFVNFKKTYWNMKMPPLAVGETYDLGFHACTPGEADTGMFYIRGVADSHDSIPEQNENNNKDTLIITILPKKKPDFVVDSVMVTPDTIYATEKFYLRAIMRNVGNAPSTDTCTSFVNFKKTYWNMKMPPLAVGETYDLGFHACTPAEADTGMFYIRGVADSHDSIPEQNENNNKDTLIITILSAKKPDLIVQSLEYKPDTLFTKATFYVNATIKNVGTLATVDSCNSYVNFLKTFWNMKTPPLAVNQTYTIASKAFTPDSSEFGDLYIKAFADSHDSIPESNENNNVETLPITVYTSTLPDYLVDSFYIKPANPTTRDSIRVYARLRNAGMSDPDTCTARIKVYDVMPTAFYELAPVPAGDTFSIYWEDVFNELTTPGNYSASIHIDIANSVKEGIETNNIDTLIFNVNP